jgi:carbon-monoxide dehydrogenase medium subunit
VPFAYHAAQTVAEATGLLAELGSEARLLAGGQSLGPMLNFRIARPAHLIDIRQVDGLASAYPMPGGGVRLGALLTHAGIEDGKAADPAAGPAGPFLTRVARGIAYRAIRNRGTLGGSLAHADPAAEWPVVMCALNAQFHLAAAQGERRVAARAFFKGELETALAADEMLIAIEIGAPPPGARCGFAKFARKAGEFALSLAAVVIRDDPDGRVADADLWLGGAGGVPVRATAAEALLRGRYWDHAVRAALPAQVKVGLPAAETAHARYLQHLHAVTLARAVDDAQQQRSRG